MAQESSHSLGVLDLSCRTQCARSQRRWFNQVSILVRFVEACAFSIIPERGFILVVLQFLSCIGCVINGMCTSGPMVTPGSLLYDMLALFSLSHRSPRIGSARM